MSEIGVRYVTIMPKIAKGFAGEINSAVSQGTAGAGKRVGDDLAKGVEQSGSRVGNAFKSVVTGALVLKGASMISGFVRGAVDDFSSLEDATAAAGVVFGSSMDKIITKSETAATTLGMSKAQVIDAANTFGTLGKSANLSGDDLASFSNQMTDVAGSLSSFKGGSPEEAILAVGAALRGESEPIRRYGILLDDATLRQQALTLGIIDNVKTALTPQQRVLAAQAAILAQSGDAMGDFGRTADSTANVQKTLAAESANLSAEIGEKLAPMIVNAQKAGIGFLRWVSDNEAAIVPLVATVGTLTLAIGGFVAVSKGIEALKAARATISGLGDAFQQMSTKAKIATASAGAVGLALTAGALIYGHFAQKNADAAAAVAEFTKAVEADTGALGENTRAAIENQLQTNGMLEAATKMGISSEALTDAMMGSSTAVEYVNRKMDEYQSANAAVSNRNTGLVAEVSQIKDGMGDMAGQIGQAQAAYADYQREAGGATDATMTATTAVMDGKLAYEDYTKAINGSYNAQLKLAGSERAAEAAIDDATATLWESAGVTDEMIDKHGKLTDEGKRLVKAYGESGKALDINTDAGRKNEEALHAIADTTLAATSSMTDLEKANGTAAERADRGRAEFVKLAKQLGLGADEAEALADKMGLLKSKEIDFKVRVIWKGNLSPKISVDGTGAGKITLRAGGGAIRGPGTGTSDDVPILASNGEWVIKEKSARYYGPGLMDAINQGRIPREVFAGKYAAGGPVMPTWLQAAREPGILPDRGGIVRGGAGGIGAVGVADLASALRQALDGLRLEGYLRGANALSDKVAADLLLTMERL